MAILAEKPKELNVAVSALYFGRKIDRNNSPLAKMALSAEIPSFG